MPRQFRLLALAASAGAIALPATAGSLTFVNGDLVIDTVSAQTTPTAGNGFALDTASPITLQELSLGAGGQSATAVGSMMLAQTNNGANSAISAEYGSASEGILQLSGNQQYLTMMGYGVNAATFNGAPLATYGTAALGQTTSVTGGSATVVPRVVALIGDDGSVDTSTALTGVFNQNNPRSAYTVNGSSFYVSGQGASKTDTTQGVFYATLGATTATVIDNSTDTRDVQIVNGVLTVSRDYNPPGSSNQQSNIDTLTNGTGTLPTNSTGVTKNVIIPTGNNGSSPNGPANGTTTFPAIYLKSSGSNGNNINGARDGNFVYASPEQFFYASPSVLYVADSGSPKNGNVEKAALGDGGLQKWVNSNPNGTGTWTLAYTLYDGLNGVGQGVVNNDPAVTTGGSSNGYGGVNDDVTGLFGLTGQVEGNGTVELFATSYTKDELDTSYLYEITDVLGDTSSSQVTGEDFTILETAGFGEAIRGVSFAPEPEPASIALFGAALAGLGYVRRKRR